MQVTKWGEDLVVRLPAALAAELGLKEGDEVEVRPVAGQVSDVASDAGREAALEALKALRATLKPLPEGYRFDREEANRRRPE
jgi:antitoxin MazE